MLKPTSIEQVVTLRQDWIFEGRVLFVLIVSAATKSSSIIMVVEDMQRDTMMVAVSQRRVAVAPRPCRQSPQPIRPHGQR